MAASRRTFLALAGASSAGMGLGVADAAPNVERGRSLPLLTTYVTGTDRYDAPLHAVRLAPGDVLTLRREPENGYDDRAISVWTPDGERKLGYVPRIHNQAMANLMDSGVPAEGRVSDVKGPLRRPDITIAVTVQIPAMLKTGDDA